jgi:hypothetical protein
MAGWYWWRQRQHAAPVVVELFWDGARWRWRDNDGRLWGDADRGDSSWGPRITPPEVPVL